jgi:nucleoside-triphosphatase
MGKVLLLTGDPGIGKTTLIRHVVESLGQPVGGFYTQEIRQGKQRKGFEIVTLDGQRGLLAHVDIHGQRRISRYGVNTTALEEVAIPTILKAVNDHAIVIIDELGPMEFCSKIFCQTVLKILQGDSSVLGSIVKRHTPFSDRIKSLPEVMLVEVTRHNRDHLVKQIRKQLL